MDYKEFINSKKIVNENSGFTAKNINSMLFDFQKDIVRWACEKGKAAIFADCGMGKTSMQLEWARQVCEETNGNVLILAPLAVSKQTLREGIKFGINTNICRSQNEVKKGINITNYEMLKNFDTSSFQGVVLDESSILKSYMGATKNQIINSFKNVSYKLACTATPAPNDHMELLNHSEFLGILKSSEALSMWFINDTMNSGKYRLKNHAVKNFWEWVSTWAICMSKPSDIGYSDKGFILPRLNEINHIVTIDQFDRTFENGMLRKIETNATAFHKEKRFTAESRALECADIVNSTESNFVVWCDTNQEAELLKKYIPEAVEIRGSDKPEKKEKAALDFIDNKIRVLISKPSIFGFGINFQNCHDTVFCGLSYSYEDYYQSIRRFWRFGQKEEVNVHIVLGSTEKQILDTIKRKQQLHEEMKVNMYGSIKEIQNANIKGISFKTDYDRNYKMQVPTWAKEENLNECG